MDDKTYFINRWNNGGGFMRNLCDTITVADGDNLALLYLAFPRLVNGYCLYHFGKDYTTWLSGLSEQ